MQRILQLDFFRGFFLIVITINHFVSNNNIIKKITSGFIGWISAAEGFVFLSGFTVGIIYTYYYQEKGKKFIYAATRKRAWLIYKTHFALYLLVAALLLITPFLYAYWANEYESLYQQPFLATLLASVFLYQPLFLDILPMYAIFMLLVPPAILSFNKKRFWPILLLSFGIYLLGTFNLAEPALNQPGWSKYILMGVFNPLCWQFLFLVGLFLGYLFKAGKIQNIHEKKKIFYLALVLSLTFFLSKQLHLNPGGLDMEYWTDKGHIRPLRLLNFACLTFLMTFLVFRYKNRFTFQPFCYLGKYSLQVFTFHILLVLLFSPFKNPLNNFFSVPVASYYIYPFETLMLIFILLGLYLAPTLFNKQVINSPKTDKI